MIPQGVPKWSKPLHGQACPLYVQRDRLDRTEGPLYVQVRSHNRAELEWYKADRAEGPVYGGGDRPDRAEGLVVAWVWAEGSPPKVGTQFV